CVACATASRHDAAPRRLPRAPNRRITMTRPPLVLTALVMLLAPLAGAETSIGYSYLKSLDDGGGSIPTGGYLSFAGARDAVSPELDLAYHRDTQDSVTLNSFTGFIGPRFGSA